MKKEYVVIFTGVVLLGVIFTVRFWGEPKAASVAIQSLASDIKDASYTIEGQTVKLVGGRAESETAPGSASKLITQYFGNEAMGDLNGNGILDTAFILTQTGGGSGTFYYVVAAIKTANGYQGTNAVLLGDRIAPQTTEIRNGEIVVNYADRKSGEPMSAAPSFGISKYLRVSDGKLFEVEH